MFQKDRSTFISNITFSVMKSRKEKWFSNIYISTNEQISRYFGKASVQDERVGIPKLELMETNSLLKKGRDDSQVGREHRCVIDLWTIIFQFEKWSRMSSSLSISESGLRFLTDRHFLVRKMVQIERSFL
jgi:hypothetical protein